MFWILQKSSRKLFPIWFLIRNTQTYRLKLSVLRVFKTPEIASIVEFFFQKQALTMSLQNNCSKQQQMLSVNLAIVFEKDFTVDVWLHKQLQKRKIKALKGKKNFQCWCQCRDADAEISKWPREISSCGLIYSNVKRAYCSASSDFGCKNKSILCKNIVTLLSQKK